MIGDIKHIIVIESLDNERETGTELYNDCIKRHIIFRNSSITHKIYKINNREDFFDICKYYEVNSPYIEGGILIHLEMHGDDNLNGLILSNMSLINWTEMANVFRPININTCNNLYISLATCYGRYLHRGVSAYEKSPYSGYISASKEVYPTEIIENFFLLFESLIESGNLVKSYLDMENQGTEFYYKDSEQLFEKSFESGVYEFLNDPQMKENILRETIEKGGQAFSDEIYKEICDLAIKDLYEAQKKAFNF